MSSGRNPIADTQRSRPLLLGVLVVAGLTALVVFYHRPQWKRYQQHQQHLEQLQHQAHTEQRQNQQLARVRLQLDRVERFLQQQRQDRVLVSPEELVAGLVQVFSGKPVQIRQFRRREVRQRAFLSEVWIDVDCQGPLPEVFRVLAELEGLSQPVWIEQLQLIPSGNRPQEVRCHLLLRGFAGHLQQSG